MDLAREHTEGMSEEVLSRGPSHSEMEVEKRVVRRVKQAMPDPCEGPHNGKKPDQDRRTEPGYYLISRGRPAFERELDFHVSWKRWLLRSYIRAAVPRYLGTIAIVTPMILALPLLLARGGGMTVKGLLLLRFA